VNVGSIDGMTKADLVHFLADTSGIDRKFFGDVTLQKNCSYFDIDGGHDKGINLKFEGVEVEGRSIRVNRDDAERQVGKRSSEDKKPGFSSSPRRSNSSRPKKEFRRPSRRR
jgi:ATP-dependent RNA helicase DeaD